MAKCNQLTLLPYKGLNNFFSAIKKPVLLEALCIWFCPSVSESVGLCIPKTSQAPYLENH